MLEKLEQELRVRSILGLTDASHGFVKLTAAMAKELLAASNTHNRKLSWATVEGYARAMQQGKWCRSNDCITFDDNFILSNGQHRLHAVVKADAELEVLVQLYVNQNSELDRGRRRTVVENISLIDAVSNTELRTDIAIITAVNIYLYTVKSFSSGSITDACVDFMNRYEEELVLLRNEGLFRGTPKMNQAAVATGFMLAYLSGVDIDTLTHIKSVLNTGMSDKDTDKPIIGLRDALIAIRGGGSAGNLERMKRVQYCINAVQAGRRTKTNKCEDLFYKLPVDFSRPM